MALNAEFELISLLCPTNTQWNRNYYEPGTFSIQLPIEQYRQDICYIYTDKRPEMGKISQINYMEQNGFESMQLSGYFLEKELDRHVVFPVGSSNNILEGPSWSNQSGCAESVAYAFFQVFQSIKLGDAESSLGIECAESKGRGEQTVHAREGEFLGEKIYTILKPSELSYRVKYDYLKNKKLFEIWQGTDRTQGNSENADPIVFSTRYGNISNPSILLDDTNYKNSCINVYERDDEVIVNAVLKPQPEDKEIHFVYNKSGINRAEYKENTKFETALEEEAVTVLEDKKKTINVEFETNSGGYVYMQDFDLGDKCSLEIHRAGISLDARLIKCHEVMKDGQWTMSMEFGTPIIRGGKF